MLLFYSCVSYDTGERSFIDWRLGRFSTRAAIVVLCSFNTAAALRTNQLTRVRCPSLEYCNARVLPGALQTWYKWASGTCTASPRFSSRDYGQVQPALSALHLRRCVRSSLPPRCMHACVDCVSISVSVYHAVPPPPPPAWRGVGRRWTASTHSLGLCISSRSDLRQTLTRFLCTLNKTPITALVSTVTGFHSLPRAVAWMADVCLNMPLCL